MSTVILASNFKIENVSFQEPRKNPSGGQSILLNYYNESAKKNGPLLMQTPKMRMPFGPDVAVDDKTGAKKYSVNTSLAGDDSTNNNLKVFTDIIRNLDEFTKKFATEHSEEWFGKKQKAELVDEFYKSAAKKPKNTKYPDTLKLKLPMKKNADKKDVPQFNIYDHTKEQVNILVDSEIDLSCLEKGGDMVAVIQCTGVWFVGKTQFGLGWKIVQVQTYKTSKLIGCVIVDEEEEVIEEEEEEEDAGEEEVVEEEEEVEVG